MESSTDMHDAQSMNVSAGSHKHGQTYYAKAKTAALILRALNHKIRQQIIKLLEEKKRMMVTDIYVKLRLEQSVASQHLAILRRANVVSTEREGKQIFYTINYAQIDGITISVNELIQGGDVRTDY